MVSIGMPVYNGARTLDRAICSIIHQQYGNWELLITDDGSTDASFKIARCFKDRRIRVLQGGSNKGLPARLNEAVGLSRGEYFARMDADDIAYPHRLGQQVAYLQAHPEVDVVGGSISIFKGDGALLGWRPAYETHETICGGLLRTFSLAHVSWMGRTEWFKQNPYDPHRFQAQDRDLLIRSHRHSRFAAVADVLVGVREERVVLSKQRRGHYEVAASLAKDGLRNREWRPLAGAALELAKFGLDVVAVATGLKYRLLKHRARPFSPGLQHEWQQVWAEVNPRMEDFCAHHGTCGFCTL